MKTIKDKRQHTWGEKVRTMFSKPENKGTKHFQAAATKRSRASVKKSGRVLKLSRKLLRANQFHTKVDNRAAP